MKMLRKIAAAFACACSLQISTGHARNDSSIDQMEARIRALEAGLSAAKSSPISLQLSGWVSERIVHWDDGVERNTYMTGLGSAFASNINFKGQARIRRRATESKWGRQPAARSHPAPRTRERRLGNQTATLARGSVHRACSNRICSDRRKAWDSGRDSSTARRIECAATGLSFRIGEIEGGLSCLGACALWLRAFGPGGFR